jgi:hypothetical protein
VMTAVVIDFEINKIVNTLNRFKETGEINIAENIVSDISYISHMLDEWNEKTKFKYTKIIDKLFTKIIENQPPEIVFIPEFQIHEPMTAESEELKLLRLAQDEYADLHDDLLLQKISLNSPLVFTDSKHNEIMTFLGYLARVAASDRHTDLDYAYIRLAIDNYDKLVFALKEAADRIGEFIIRWQNGEGNDFITLLSNAYQDRDKILESVKLLNDVCSLQRQG